MKTTTLAKNGVSTEMVGLISHLVDLIPWPTRRHAMSEVTLLLLDGKHRVAENVFGWSRSAVEIGIHEFQTGISCVNNISTRLKPKTESPRQKRRIQSYWPRYTPSWSHKVKVNPVCEQLCYIQI